MAALSKEEYAKYWESEKVFYDNDGAMRTARNKGLEEGRAEGLAEGLEKGRTEGRAEERMTNARSLKEHGVPIDVIARSLSLTNEEIGAL